MSDSFPLPSPTIPLPDAVTWCPETPSAAIIHYFQAPRIAQFQTISGGKSLLSPISFWNCSTSPAVGSVFCFCNDAQEPGLAIVSEGGATNCHAIHCLSSWLPNLHSGFMLVPLPLHNHLLWLSFPQVLARYPKTP
jgi:hypothetical protein